MESLNSNKNTQSTESAQNGKYGIPNCDNCGDGWPTAVTVMRGELENLCNPCLEKAVQDYKIAQIKGTNKF